jgi:hypothetical protein
MERRELKLLPVIKPAGIVRIWDVRRNILKYFMMEIIFIMIMKINKQNLKLQLPNNFNKKRPFSLETFPNN